MPSQPSLTCPLTALLIYPLNPSTIAEVTLEQPLAVHSAHHHQHHRHQVILPLSYLKDIEMLIVIFLIIIIIVIVIVVVIIIISSFWSIRKCIR